VPLTAPQFASSSASLASTLSGAVLSGSSVSKPTPEEAQRMLRPYVTAWGADPIWESAVPEQTPTVAAFPRHTGSDDGLTLAELPASVAVAVAAHDVYFDRSRKLWYCDIEIDAGDSYFPFVRLALARYQAHSLAGAHLSRVVMTDFIQLTPDRTADIVLCGSGAAEVTVRGYSGRNILAGLARPSFLPADLAPVDDTAPNTTVRVTLERRHPGVPGELGWERVGSEVTLAAKNSGFDVTWSGTIPVPEQALEAGRYRLLVTEVETYLRDLIAGDPMVSTSPLDYVRERVVYADIFEL
jgi:hypothetical protein